LSEKFFPLRPEVNPTIYAYEDTNPKYNGLLKVGYTTRDAKTRVAGQYPTRRPGELPYRIVLEEKAMRDDGSSFMDKDVHKYLRKMGISNPAGEWFRCTVKEVKSAILAVQKGVTNEANRTQTFKLRPEQEAAIEKTIAYFESFKSEPENKERTPHFLWNAKMRFGKTFAAYHLAKRMGWKKILVLTFKPAVKTAWEEDLLSHIDFAGWQFYSEKGLTFEISDNSKPLVCFGSFQDFLGKNEAGGIKPKNEWVHTTNWDCVILDEYHYGAWRENAKDLFEEEDKKEIQFGEGVGIDYFDEEFMPITTNHYLYLSGTPFRAIASGEFIEEQIFNWTYSDEQRAKAEWSNPNEPNPYESLPRMVMLTYQLPPAIKDIALKGEFNEFDLNEFFKAEGEFSAAKFIHENEVQKWLDLIRGAHSPATVDNLKLGDKKPPFPYSDRRFLQILSHTFWFLPSVSACHAMANLFRQEQNDFYRQFGIVVAAGSGAGIGAEALPPVSKEMDNPVKTRTITLSCGKLTTGVSVKPWSGIFMLRNSSSPETYFQAAFRVQTPWVIKNPDGENPNQEEILKRECYVFDFAPDRALRQIADYSCRLDVNNKNPEEKVAEFISFLPILAYDGSSMKQIDAAGVLDMAMSGTTATLLARRWESALLVNVDNNTLRRLLANEKAMAALMSIEGFRSLNQDIETIINKSETIKKLKNSANDRELSDKEKRELTAEEKEYKSKRKMIQEKLIKFATRIPVFLYLTDFREFSLQDIIRELEPDLFKRVTGLSIPDFELLVSLGLFNEGLMNDAVYKFKRYEDPSLAYTGVNRHNETSVGLYNTVISAKEYGQTFENEPVN